MINKLCISCKRIIPYPLSYCAACQKKFGAERSKSAAGYNRRARNSRNDKFYHSKAWRTLSVAVMASADYKCAECGDIACEVHHIVSINEDWSKRLAPGNVQPLCTRCHNRKRRG